MPAVVNGQNLIRATLLSETELLPIGKARHLQEPAFENHGGDEWRFTQPAAGCCDSMSRINRAFCKPARGQVHRFSGNGTMHERILDKLSGRHDRSVMNNVERSVHVECMIAIALGSGWKLTWEDGRDWAAWDCDRIPSGARLEIKQSAARQTWDRGPEMPRRNPVFDIAPRQGCWTKDGSRRVPGPGRPADLHVFAWHGRRDEQADQRDAGQWRFLAVAERSLPTGQKSIVLSRLEKIATSCGVAELGRAVEEICPAREELKATRESPIAGL